MQTFFENNNSNKLLLFFLGWGMDELPMIGYFQNKDVLYFYNYSNLDFNLNFDYSKYESIELLTFSAGALVSMIVKDKLPKISKKISVNGTGHLLLKESEEIFKNLKYEDLSKFRMKYLFSTEKEMIKYLEKGRLRSWDDCFEELYALFNLGQKYIFQNEEFDEIYISKNDNVIPTKFQIDYWKKKYKLIDGKHFPFFNDNNEFLKNL